MTENKINLVFSVPENVLHTVSTLRGISMTEVANQLAVLMIQTSESELEAVELLMYLLDFVGGSDV